MKLVIKSVFIVILERQKIIRLKKRIKDIYLSDNIYKTTTSDYFEKLIVEPSPLFEVMAYQIIKVLLKQTNVNHVIYPYEEKTIERAILMAIKDLNLDIKSTAFAHAAYSDGHLYTVKQSLKKLIPSRIALTGPLQYKKFLYKGWSPEELEIVGSPRYRRTRKYKKQLFRIVVLVGYKFELLNFYNWIKEEPRLAKTFDISIRNHPNLIDKETAKIEKKLELLGIKIKNSKESLMESINYASVVLYESTSSAIEASLEGKYLIKIRISDAIDSNHFKDENNCIAHCKTSKELFETLWCIKNTDEEQMQKNVICQQKLTAQYYTFMDYSKLFNFNNINK